MSGRRTRKEGACKTPFQTSSHQRERERGREEERGMRAFCIYIYTLFPLTHTSLLQQQHQLFPAAASGCSSSLTHSHASLYLSEDRRRCLAQVHAATDCECERRRETKTCGSYGAETRRRCVCGAGVFCFAASDSLVTSQVSQPRTLARISFSRFCNLCLHKSSPSLSSDLLLSGSACVRG